MGLQAIGFSKPHAAIKAAMRKIYPATFAEYAQDPRPGVELPLHR